jgi:outer membrane protein OmpA-like peptidoglycan-associated protein
MLLNAAVFPIDFSFSNVVNVKEKHQNYGMLKDLKREHYGEYWERKYTFSDKLDHKARFTQMSQSVLNTLENPSFAFDRYGHMQFEFDDEEYLLKLKAYSGKSATIELLRSAAHTRFLSLEMTQWPLKKQLAKKGTDAPLLLVAPFSSELEVKRLKYKKYDEQSFRVKKHVLNAKGKYWIVEYGLKNYDKHNALRFRAVHDYRRLLRKEGAKITMDGNNGFMFELDYEGKHYVGNFDAYENSMSLKVVEEEAFEQALVLSPDKLKAELDAKGKVTLEGIYFDTNKATLKKESTQAITSAASLMKHYSDLVLEVQGHTDNQGDDAYNADLSNRRAAAVVKALVAEGVEGERLKSKGFGEAQPVADNATKEGRAQNRRVELHRISGGSEITMIGIDFIKPLPNAKTNSERRYENGSLTIHHTPPYVEKKQTETIHSEHHDVYEYVVERKGKRDMSFSRTEILLNYKNILPMLGAKLLGEYQSNLYFMFQDRGDKRTLYGVIKAFDGMYEVHVHTMSVKEQKKPKTRPVAVVKTFTCKPDVVGTWYAKPKMSNTYNTKNSGAFLPKLVNVKLTLRDDKSMVLGDDSAPEKGVWSIEEGKILLKSDPQQPAVEASCLDNDTLLITLDIIKDEPTRLVFTK